MRGKTFITSCCLAALMACGTAFAQQGKLTSGAYKGPMMPMVTPDAPAAGTFYTNLVANACTGCNYSANNGFLLLGPNNCGPTTTGATQWLAYPFVSTKSGLVRKVVLAITDWSVCTPTSHGFTVGIYTDACGLVPGTLIGNTRNGNAPAAPCSLASVNFGAAAGVNLIAGNAYWVVVTTNGTGSQNATTAVWWQVNAADSSFNLNDGNGWQVGPLGGPGGFTVQ